MDIPTIPGAVYSIASSTSCDVTDKASGKPLGTATPGSPVTTPAYSDALTLSDPDALYVQIKTFNFALAALGLLGGGEAASALPAGYLAAEFLESNGYAYMEVPLVVNTNEEAVKLETEHCNTGGGGFVLEGVSKTFCQGMYNKTSFCVYVNGNGFAAGELKTNDWNKHISLFEGKVITQVLPAGEEATRSMSPVSIDSYKIFRHGTQYWESFPGKKKNWRATVGGVVQFDLIPVIDENGDSGMLNKVDNVFYGNLGEKPFIVGFTLAQARKLGNLPTTGGTMTISLPTGYETDAGVMAALETARANGWTLTIQTYEAETAVATFGMRRIWVRRQQDENGMYIDADGTRWQVDWCVDILTPDNSTPDAHGYELFRSQEAAVEYWELVPYVDPETEKLLNENTNNE